MFLKKLSLRLNQKKIIMRIETLKISVLFIGITIIRFLSNEKVVSNGFDSETDDSATQKIGRTTESYLMDKMMHNCWRVHQNYLGRL